MMILYNAAECETCEQFQLIQLCERTSKRIANSKEPTTVKQIDALGYTVEGKLVRSAMLEEVLWMVNNGKVVPKRKSTVPNLFEIDGKWVVKYKKTLNGLLDRVRARWVLRGDKQRPYVDFDPKTIYSPVSSKAGTLSTLVVAVQYSLQLYCLDVSKAFTVSPIDEEGVHISVPAGMDQEHPDYAPYGADTTWELLTSLYGLRQASSKYYETFSKTILAYTDPQGQKYRRNNHDPCVFTKGKLGSSDYITFSIHIDDKFIACSGKSQVDELEKVLNDSAFKCTVESMSKALGVGIEYTPFDKGVPGSGKLVFDHSAYILDCYNEAKQHFDPSKHSPLNIPMSESDSKSNVEPEPEFEKDRYKLFRSILGKVGHCANFTHPEISVAVSIVSQRMTNPSDRDLRMVFDILRYLYGTTLPGNEKAKMTFKYNPLFDPSQSTSQNPIHLLCDADLSNCKETRRSRTGYACYLFGNLTGWNSRRQQSVSLSTAESEYVALSACAQYGKWYQGLVSDMGIELAYYEPVVILTDSQSARNIANSPINAISKYSKHIEQRVHWFRELIRAGTLRVNFIPGNENIADIFTKCLAKPKFRMFRDRLMQGDFRNHRAIKGMSCIMQYLYRDYRIGTNPSDCNCHDDSYTCHPVQTHTVLLHCFNQ